MALEEYRRRRDFSSTPEPSGTESADPGGRPSGRGRRFVVQRHRATRLHYDLRLEVGDVLVSWAVPKGPTLDSTVRRMAVRVEDHPLEYFDFEGVIPAGQYGAGDVVVWDWGTWEPEDPEVEPRSAIDGGELKFTVAGEKLRGRFTIVRTAPRPGDPLPDGAAGDGRGDQWLLIHKRDEHAVADWDAEDHPRSVRSGRTNDEVKADAPALWVSSAPATEAEIDLAEAVAAPMPTFVEPMRATLADAAFRHDDWLFEVKWDGYRVEAVVREASVRLFTRNGNDAAEYFPGLLSTPGWITAREAIVDGEVVALDATGRPDFTLLAERIAACRAGDPTGLVYEVFDLLHLDGRSLLAVPLADRKKLLRLVLREGRHVRYASHVEADGVAFLAAATDQGLEGIMAKHRRSAYQPGRRTSAWLKVKIRPEQEFVVGGWTCARGRPDDLGALVVGVHDGRALRYAGKIGSGLGERARAELLAALAPLGVAEPPFDPPPAPDRRGQWGGDLAGVTWVRPELVVRAELAGWSREGIVRQAAFTGIDRGRDPRQVVREQPVDVGVAVGPAPEPGVPEPGARTGAPVPGPALGPSLPPAHPWEASGTELEALDALVGDGVWDVGGHAVRLTNLDKELFPARPGASPVTKRELVGYFARIAPAMLAHLAGRPLNLHRFPDGAARPGFWQKDIPEAAPSWLVRWHEPTDAPRQGNDHLVADRLATLVWLANQAAFEVHPWTSTCAQPSHPTFALIDIDPGPRTTWDETLTLARLYRTALAHLGVRGFPKTTGSRGLQVWIPVERGRYEFRQTSEWVQRLSRAVGATVPELVSWQWATRDRDGRARLDYTQNAAMRTLVAPYAVRPRPGAPVSMPIEWDELDDPDLRSDRWTIRDAPARVAERGDLFAAAQLDAQELPPL